jgi:uncharacterized membrane protein (DUF2068 family)
MKRNIPAMLIAIAVFKLLVAFALGAVGILQLLRSNADPLLYGFLDKVGFDPQNPYIDALAISLLDLSHLKIKLISAAALVYSSLFFVEGFGLYFDLKWAELFTVIVTSGFIPFEVYELVTKAHWSKILVISINTAIVAYLLYRLRQKKFFPARSDVDIDANIS